MGLILGLVLSLFLEEGERCGHKPIWGMKDYDITLIFHLVRSSVLVLLLFLTCFLNCLNQKIVKIMCSFLNLDNTIILICDIT